MKLKYYIVALTAAISVLSGCDQNVDGTLFDESNKTGFSFAGTVLYMETSAEDDGILRIPIYRVASSGNTVNISFEVFNADSNKYLDSDPTRLLRLATSRVMFADGQNTSYVQVTYSSLEALGLTTKHQFRLNITDDMYPGGVKSVAVTVNRKLTYELLGKGTCFDEFLFYETYTVDIYKAAEAKVYRVMDPFSEGLAAEDYVAGGWYCTPSAYVQIDERADGTLHFDEFRNGMFFQKRYYVYGIHPDDRTENTDVDLTKFVSRWTGEKQMTLYPFYYIKNYGHFECKQMVITLP